MESITTSTNENYVSEIVKVQLSQMENLHMYLTVRRKTYCIQIKVVSKGSPM